MKIGFYCESPSDKAAMEVFTEGLLGEPTEPINMDLEALSVPGFFSALDCVFRGVHYHSDAEGLVIVVDCDESELYEADHDFLLSLIFQIVSINQLSRKSTLMRNYRDSF